MNGRGAGLGMAATACAVFVLGGCASKPAPAPRPAPAAVRPVLPPAPPPPETPPAASDWPDLPLTPGDWTYAADSSGSRAAFAQSVFVIRCDSGRRQLFISREGAAGPLRLSTTYGERAVAPGAALSADDSRLDEIAFSRGRFAVEAEGMERLIVPAWPEPARVIEDCRG